MRNRVAIYARTLLPISQTFIRSQAQALTSWDPVLIGRSRAKGGLDLSDMRVEIVPEAGGGVGRALRFWPQRSEPRLLSRLAQLDVRLVHAHFGTDATDIWPTVKAARLPMVVTLHGYDINTHRWWWEAGHGGLFRRWYPRRLLSMAQDPAVRFIAVSRAIKERAVEFGIPGDKVSVSYIGVDTEIFKPSGLPLQQRPRRVLFVGRMVEKKAPLLMIRAFAELVQRVPDAELVMIGDGPLLERARSVALSLDVPAQLLGASDSHTVQQNLQEARIFCLPSVTAANGDAEGLPISVLEAMACGVPVITSASGAVGEAVIDGVTGECFRENDEQALCNHMGKLLSEDLLLNERAIEARSRAIALFSIRDMAKNLEQTYWSSFQ